ncbi:hypothetical protein EYF80_044448 [Liparis tanakae]|uniref:Uncharacterized protein n=1 Tax=Liparis tanakae TaxID=230148 RepID=A0A4Z2FXT1_9TELE|nr:hypothetical protein EYF80_044448 [Liparis tanakae]
MVPCGVMLSAVNSAGMSIATTEHNGDTLSTHSSQHGRLGPGGVFSQRFAGEHRTLHEHQSSAQMRSLISPCPHQNTKSSVLISTTK